MKEEEGKNEKKKGERNAGKEWRKKVKETEWGKEEERKGSE